MTEQTKNWWIFKGSGPHDGITELPPPPSWRKYQEGKRPAVVKLPAEPDPRFVASEHEKELVNAALYLRRPLLITGKPGTGKSSLARAVAYELKLGRVLEWPINTRSTLHDGLYRYDAIGRMQDASIRKADGARGAKRPGKAGKSDITEFLRLGPLGTALAPSARPRVLLIDEIDKSDIDLPNDLLHVLERGEFEIPELARLGKDETALPVRPVDDGPPVPIEGGRVKCWSFPLILLTSNGERDFPPAFLRRCLRLEMETPDEVKLQRIIEHHFGPELVERARPYIQRFLAESSSKELATDQLLNAIYLATNQKRSLTEQHVQELLPSLFRNLSGFGNP